LDDIRRPAVQKIRSFECYARSFAEYLTIQSFALQFICIILGKLVFII
jgi:hypothetical protein